MSKTKLKNSPLSKTVKLISKNNLKPGSPNPARPPTAALKRTTKPTFE